ncbi:MBL fold metallo-hydrolase [Rhodococcus sp. 1.20]
MIDGGYPANGTDVERSIEQIGHQLGDVRAILVTHAHIDHIGGIADIVTRLEGSGPDGSVGSAACEEGVSATVVAGRSSVAVVAARCSEMASRRDRSRRVERCGTASGTVLCVRWCAGRSRSDRADSHSWAYRRPQRLPCSRRRSDRVG